MSPLGWCVVGAVVFWSFSELRLRLEASQLNRRGALRQRLVERLSLSALRSLRFLVNRELQFRLEDEADSELPDHVRVLRDSRH